MAETGRLDELQRKFDENPRRYFAPLANEYRKVGDTTRAIELCRTYLPHLPGHMSGYIVYGQSLYDSGRAMEAAAVFQEALRIDPENVIALRHLGDIARLEGDRAAALDWYRKVLEFDPKNEEISAYLSELAVDTPEGEAPVEDSEEAAGPLEIDALETGAPETTTVESEGGLPALQGQSDESEGALPELQGQPYEDGLDHAHAAEETAAFFERSSERVEVPSQDELGYEPMGGWEPTELISDAESVSAMLEVPVQEDQAQQPDTNVVPTPFVTETMAELYLQQGMTSDALLVYQQLAAARDEPHLHEKVRELETQLAAEAGEPESESELDATEVPSEPRVTVHEFFAKLGQARPSRQQGDLAPSSRPGADQTDALSDPHTSSSLPENASSSESISPDESTGLSHLFGAHPTDSADDRAAQSLADAFSRRA